MSFNKSLFKSLMVGTALMLATTACTHLNQEQAAMTTAKSPAERTDADMQQILDAQASFNPKPITLLSAVEARKQASPADGAKKVLREKGKNPADPMGVATRNIMVSGGAGLIPARVYTPMDKKPSELLPVVVYYHGGGFVIATNDTYDSSPRAIAKMANAIVVSVEYRKAPENKFPAQHDDAFAAYKWVLKNGRSIGADTKRVAVMGESAGGNLAINTAIKARDAKIQAPVREVLVYPIAGVDMNTPSYTENALAKPLSKGMMEWFVKQTIRSDADKKDARLDLNGKANLANLPPTTIIAAEIDPLRSDGLTLSQRLEANGNDVNYKVYEGVTHEFFGMGALLPEALAAEAIVAKDLRLSFLK